MRALTSAGARTCRRCGLSHRKMESYKIGKFIYGDKPKDSKARWFSRAKVNTWIEYKEFVVPRLTSWNKSVKM